MRYNPAAPWREVVGVVGDVRSQGLDTPATDAVYVTLGEPFAQDIGRTARFMIRSERVGTPGFLQDIRGAMWSVDPGVPLFDVGTLGDLGVTAAMSRFMESLLFGVTALDLRTYALAALVLLATAALAAYLPARRVTRVNPMRALRAE